MLQMNNLGIRALGEYCKSTLTSVDLSDCTGLNDEVGLRVVFILSRSAMGEIVEEAQRALSPIYIYHSKLYTTESS